MRTTGADGVGVGCVQAVSTVRLGLRAAWALWYLDKGDTASAFAIAGLWAAAEIARREQAKVKAA